MKVDRDPLLKTAPLHADKRGTELNEKEQQLLSVTLETIGNHINKYWAQKQWRIDRSFLGFASRKDTYDQNCTVYYLKPVEYNEKVVEKLTRTLSSCGFQVIGTSKKYLVIEIDKKKIRKNACAFAAGEEILKKQESNNQALLEHVASLIQNAVFQNKSDRYDFAFKGFDPKIISKYLKKTLPSDSGFEVKPLKIYWEKRIVKLSELDYMIFYRPVATFSLVFKEIGCFSLRSRIRCLTNCYKQTFYFGGLDREI